MTSLRNPFFVPHCTLHQHHNIIASAPHLHILFLLILFIPHMLTVCKPTSHWVPNVARFQTNSHLHHLHSTLSHLPQMISHWFHDTNVFLFFFFYSTMKLASALFFTRHSQRRSSIYELNSCHQRLALIPHFILASTNRLLSSLLSRSPGQLMFFTTFSFSITINLPFIYCYSFFLYSHTLLVVPCFFLSLVLDCSYCRLPPLFPFISSHHCND